MFLHFYILNKIYSTQEGSVLQKQTACGATSLVTYADRALSNHFSKALEKTGALVYFFSVMFCAFETFFARIVAHFYVNCNTFCNVMMDIARMVVLKTNITIESL